MRVFRYSLMILLHDSGGPDSHFSFETNNSETIKGLFHLFNTFFNLEMPGCIAGCFCLWHYSSFLHAVLMFISPKLPLLSSSLLVLSVMTALPIHHLLYWLSRQYRIDFKVVILFKCLSGLALSSLTEMLCLFFPSRFHRVSPCTDICVLKLWKIRIVDFGCLALADKNHRMKSEPHWYQ